MPFLSEGREKRMRTIPCVIILLVLSVSALALFPVPRKTLLRCPTLRLPSSLLNDVRVELPTKVEDIEHVVRKTGTILVNDARTLRIERFENNAATYPRPPLLFLPGLDGVGDYFNDILNMTTNFDLYRLKVSAEDRSTFLTIAKFADAAIAKIRREYNNQSIVLVGESFGALVAAYQGIRAASETNTSTISQLVLINPATSYDRTIWPTLGAAIANVPQSIFPAVGIATLLATAVEPAQIRKIGEKVISRMNSTEAVVTEVRALLESGNKLVEVLPQSTLEWRLDKWLAGGNFIINNRYGEIKTATLILVGENDRLLPSREEGRILKRVLTGAPIVELIEYPGSGHALLDGSIDLSQVIRNSRGYRMSRHVAPPSKEMLSSVYCPYPSPEDIEQAERQLKPLARAISPVFLSRTKDGALRRGLASVPTGASTGRPVLLVGNHQLYGLDTGLVVRQFLRERQTLIRGLAHPALFGESPNDAIMGGKARGAAGGRDDQNIRELFTKFGAVKVSPTAYLDLLRLNETILLFPGGVREAYHFKGEQYRVIWPEKIDFVRMAALTDAIIVPFGAIGVADSVNMILDGKEILDTPYFGERAKAMSDKIQQARPGGSELFVAPFSLPKTPARNYFLFQEPFDTRDLDIYNKAQCRDAYRRVRERVEDAIQTLLRFRDADPYRDFIPRTIYESIAGENVQAPTAPLNVKWW